MHFWSIFFPALCSAASWMLSAGPNLARSDYLPLLSSCKMTSEGLPKSQGHTEEYPRNIPESANNIHRGLEQRMYEKEQKGCWNEEKVVGGSCCCLQLTNGRGQRSQSQALFKGAQWEFKKQQTQIGTNEIVIIYNWGKKKHTMCVIKHWHKLPRVAVASPSSKILKTWLEKDLSRSSWAADWTRCS